MALISFNWSKVKVLPVSEEDKLTVNPWCFVPWHYWSFSRLIYCCMTEWVFKRVWRASDCLINRVGEEVSWVTQHRGLFAWPLTSCGGLLDAAPAAPAAWETWCCVSKRRSLLWAKIIGVFAISGGTDVCHMPSLCSPVRVPREGLKPASGDGSCGDPRERMLGTMK